MAASSQDSDTLQVSVPSVTESSSDEDTTTADSRRSFAPKRNPGQYKAKFKVGDEAVYVETLHKSSPMDVVITASEQDPTGRWIYQVKDEESEPVTETGKTEAAWISEGKLSKRRRR